MLIRIRLTYTLRSEWSQVVEVPDDASDSEMDQLVAFWDDKIEGDQYTPDTDVADPINYFEILGEGEEEAAVVTYGRGTGLFPPKATLATVKDEYAAAEQVDTALRAHGFHTETDDTAVMFTLDGRKYRLELTPEE